MSESRIKIKVGEHEFEAEGPADLVREQFTAFKEMIASIAPEEKTKTPEATSLNNGNPANSGGALNLDNITRNEGRVISLTVHTDDLEEAVLILLLGQRQYRTNDQVTGSEIMDGLRESGHVIARVDGVLDRLAGSGHVIRIGTGRARRYRLTNIGLLRAQEAARQMISVLPS